MLGYGTFNEKKQQNKVNLTKQFLICCLCMLYNSCRYGALSRRRKAHMRAWSQILTVRQGLESSAPSPIHASSLSTLAAKQMLPWTPSTSVSFGNAAFCQCCLSAWSEMDCREDGSKYWQCLSGQGTQYHWKLMLPCHLMLIRLLIRTKWGCFVWRFAIFTASPQELLFYQTAFPNLWSQM